MIIDTSRIASALAGLVGPTLSANPKSRAAATFVVVLRMRRTSLQALVLHTARKVTIGWRLPKGFGRVLLRLIMSIY